MQSGSASAASNKISDAGQKSQSLSELIASAQKRLAKQVALEQQQLLNSNGTHGNGTVLGRTRMGKNDGGYGGGYGGGWGGGGGWGWGGGSDNGLALALALGLRNRNSWEDYPPPPPQQAAASSGSSSSGDNGLSSLLGLALIATFPTQG